MATSLATKDLLTWNRTNLLRTLPTSKTTLSNPLKAALRDGKLIVRRFVQSAASKAAVSQQRVDQIAVSYISVTLELHDLVLSACIYIPLHLDRQHTHNS